MHSRRFKTAYFALEGLNSCATVYFFSYLYFFMEKTFGFDNRANLTLAAVNGAIYAATALEPGSSASVSAILSRCQWDSSS